MVPPLSGQANYLAAFVNLHKCVEFSQSQLTNSEFQFVALVQGIVDFNIAILWVLDVLICNVGIGAESSSCKVMFGLDVGIRGGDIFFEGVDVFIFTIYLWQQGQNIDGAILRGICTIFHILLCTFMSITFHKGYYVKYMSMCIFFIRIQRK